MASEEAMSKEDKVNPYASPSTAWLSIPSH